MGQRIQKNGTRFIYDGVQMLQESDLNNQTLRSNTFTNEGYGDLVSENDGTDSSFPTFNGQSSTDAIVNKTATVTDRIGYSAFGGEDSHTGSSTTPFRFVGKQSYYNDAETGLYLLGAGGNPNGAGRYYDPELGRFISRDPIGLAGGDANLYRYAGNNPVNGIDPSGAFTCGDWCKWRYCAATAEFVRLERIPGSKWWYNPFYKWRCVFKIVDVYSRCKGCSCPLFKGREYFRVPGNLAGLLFCPPFIRASEWCGPIRIANGIGDQDENS
jgi:RHS repeat-associated protein